MRICKGKGSGHERDKVGRQSWLVIRGNAQGRRNCSMPTVSCGRGGNDSCDTWQYERCRDYVGWGGKNVSEGGRGGGKYKETYFNTLDGLWFMFMVGDYLHFFDLENMISTQTKPLGEGGVATTRVPCDTQAL